MSKRTWHFCVIWTGLLAGLVAGWPRPSALREKGRWTLDVTYEHPVLIHLPQAGSSQPKDF